MRSSFLVSSLWLSGGVNAVVEYATRLAARGHEVAIVVPRGAVDPCVAQRLIGVSILEAGTPEDVTARSPLGKKIRVGLALLSAVPPSDVIIATHAPTALIALRAAKRQRVRKAVWFYQDYSEMFEGRPYEYFSVHRLPRYFDDILVVSRSSADEIRKFGGRRVTVVRQGLSDESLFFPPAQFDERENGLLVYIGDMRPRKGLFDFLSAVEQLYSHLPDLHLAVVSKSEIQITTRVPLRIYYRPPREELAGLLRRCNAFVSASWWESFGLPPLEAMACGAPVVLTDSRGVSEYARSGENCLMVPPRDPPALAAAIERVISDRNLAEKLAESGSPTAREYRWEECVNRFESVLLKNSVRD